MASLGGAALFYVNRGLLVFPLHPGTKKPATRNGFHDASMAPDTIRAWWAKNPMYNIGLSTGHLFDVIDLDGPDGIRNSATMEDQVPFPNPIGYAKTPHGYHLYIPPTGDGCATGIVDGIDYRGRGGYVVAPPSTVTEPCTKTWCDQTCIGATYRWITPLNIG